MENIRIGNDINIEWAIFRDGEPESLDGKNISVFMTNGYRKVVVKDPNIRDNVIQFTYLGKDQEHNGVYTLTLIENKGEEGMYTVDACEAFRLVPRSCAVGGNAGCGNIKVNTVRLTGDIKVPVAGSGSGTSDYNELSNKPSINGTTLKGNMSFEELGIQPTGDYATRDEIPVLPDNIVIDPNYTHTDNNLTDILLEKLNGLSNYDDTALREALTSEISRAKEVEGDLDTAIKKVASDLSTFITGDPDADNIINRWQEVVAFLSGITEEKDLTGLLMDLRTQMTEDVATKLSGYYTSGQVDDKFVARVIGSRLMTEDEGRKIAGLDAALERKVDKVDGKGLSSNDLTNELLEKIRGLSNYDDSTIKGEITSIKSDIDTLLGEGASDAIDTFHEIEDFLRGITDKQTLTGLLNDLKKEVTAIIPTKTSQLQNDDNTVKDASYIHTDNNFSNKDKTKLSGIEEGAKVNVNADWNATEGDALILNKPTLAAVATSGSYDDLAGKPVLATVATSGSYNDLKDVPDPTLIEATDGEYSEYNVQSVLINILFSDETSITQDEYDAILSAIPVGKIACKYSYNCELALQYGIGEFLLLRGEDEGEIYVYSYSNSSLDGSSNICGSAIIKSDLSVISGMRYTTIRPENTDITIQSTYDQKEVSISLHTGGDGTKALMDDGTYKSIPSLEDQYAYGVEWDMASSSPDGKRMGNMRLHRDLPVQNGMRRCILDNNGGVVMYDTEKLEEGYSEITNFASMTRIPQHWYKMYFNGTRFRMMLSEIPLPGYKCVNEFYISTTEARLDRDSMILCSCYSVGSLAGSARGGDNTAEWDGTYRSLLGRPVTNLTRDQFRQAARKRGSGWEMYTYNAHKTLFWLFAVEYATLDSQKPFNAQKDANGFAQGGLGPGPTQMTDWTNFNNANPLIPCGYTNEFGNGSGEKAYVVKNASGGTHATLMANRYRGIENPFGHIWKYTDGANIQVTTGDSGLSILWTTDDPSNFSDTSYTGYDKKGNICRTNGYAKKMLLGEDGDIVATEIGGSSSTYWCDYYYTYTSANRMQVVLVGGYADDGSSAGLARVSAGNAPSAAARNVGSRLCFFPEYRKTSA